MPIDGAGRGRARRGRGAGGVVVCEDTELCVGDPASWPLAAAVELVAVLPTSVDQLRALPVLGDDATCAIERTSTDRDRLRRGKGEEEIVVSLVCGTDLGHHIRAVVEHDPHFSDRACNLAGDIAVTVEAAIAAELHEHVR